MDPEAFGRGLLFGLAIAAPVGPIGVLCIRRTLAQGRLMGLVTGLGAATADAGYGALAALGMAAAASWLLRVQLPLQLAGGLLLGYLGLRMWRTAPAAEPAPVTARGLAAAYGSTLALTIANPMTVLSFAALLASLPRTGNGAWLVAGVFGGSALWWLVLSTVVGGLRERVTPALMRGINRLAGTVVLGFGLVTLARLGAP